MRSRPRTALAIATAVGLTGALLTAAPAATAAQGSKSTEAPTVRAPRLHVDVHRRSLGSRLIFTAPKVEGTPPANAAIGPLISDADGKPVWFHSVPAGQSATDFRVQRYHGKPVLTYWQGTSLAGAGHGDGVDHILDTHYRQIATVHAVGGQADQHEFQLTDRGTALITSYQLATVDARSVGGPADQKVWNGVVQEIDVRTGKLLLDWSSLAHVPLRDSHQPLPSSASTPWDWFHVNAVRPDSDGNLLISARHTWTVYEVARHTGRVIWELGGRQSSFRLGAGVRFAWQHDPEPEGHDVYRIFDNESNGTPVRPYTRIVTIKVDPHTHRATLLSSVHHPAKLSVPSQGNSQLLPGGRLFVGWGALGRVSEFDAKGRLAYDALLPAGYDTYRAFLQRWTGRPDTRPTITAVGDGRVRVSWNGETGVARWRILGGPSTGRLHVVRTVAWTGLSRVIRLGRTPAHLRVEALDARGRILGRS